jgi:hypothetical protein
MEQVLLIRLIILIITDSNNIVSSTKEIDHGFNKTDLINTVSPIDKINYS